MLDQIKQKLLSFIQLTKNRIIKVLKGNPEIEALRRKFYMTYKDIAWCLVNNREFKTRRCLKCGKVLHIKHFYCKEFPYYCSQWCLNHCDIAMDKRRQTIKEKYNTDNVSKLDFIKRQKEETMLKHYGVKYGTQSETIQQKAKATNLAKYGTEYTFQAEAVKEKIKQTNLERYGVTCALQNSIVRDKQKQTNLKKYGCIYSSQNKEIQAKILNTRQQKYGTLAVNRTKEAQLESNNILHIKAYNSIQNNKNTVIPLFTLEEYQNICHLESNKYKRRFKWKCNKCGEIFESYYANGHIPVCPFCKLYNKSKPQLEIEQFLNNEFGLKIISSTRNIISPLELDVYIPELRLAIEYNGTYWHSTECLPDKDYHLIKSKLCEEKGIHLIHIWEWEWIDNKEKVLNFLKDVIADKQNNNNGSNVNLYIKTNNNQLEIDIAKFNLKNQIPTNFDIVDQLDCRPYSLKNNKLTVYDCGCYILKTKI